MTEANTVSASGYTADGFRVYVNLEIKETGIAAAIATLLAGMRDAGLTARELGIEEGEQTETIACVVRREKVNDDNTTTPRIDLYAEKFDFKTITIYLNTNDDVRAFESACGVRLADLPLYDSETALERNKNAQKDRQYVRVLPHSVQIVMKQNPRYEGENDKKNPKRLFVHWHGVQPVVPQQTASSTPAATPCGNPILDDLAANGDTTPRKPTELEWQAWVNQKKTTGWTVKGLLAALDIKKFSEYPGDLVDASQELDGYLVVKGNKVA